LHRIRGFDHAVECVKLFNRSFVSNALGEGPGEVLTVLPFPKRVVALEELFPYRSGWNQEVSQFAFMADPLWRKTVDSRLTAALNVLF